MSGCWVVYDRCRKQEKISMSLSVRGEIKRFFIKEGDVFGTSFSETRCDELPIIKLPDDGKNRVQLVERCVVRRW